VVRDRVLALVEAILATARSPVTEETMAEAIGDPEVTSDDVSTALDMLRSAWDAPSRGLRLERVAGGWRAVTPPDLDAELRAFHGLQQKQRLSQAALEVLAIVAHRQPVTQPEINFIRGTNSTAVLRTLLDRGLIRMAGRKEVVGKPFLYRTTKEFLVHFGLDRIEELPEPEEIAGGEGSDEESVN